MSSRTMGLTKRKRLGYSLILLCLSYAAVELAAYGAYRWWSGEWFRFARLRAAQDAASASDADRRADDAQSASAYGVALHPYLGFVFDPAQLAGRSGDPAYGFVTTEGPLLRRDPDTVIVGVTGGSVAEMFGRLGADELGRELRRHPAYADKRIKVVGLGIGGHKQPQQLLTLNYLLALGGEFDVVVNLDGFNEVALPALELVPIGINPFYPRGWQVLAADSADPALLRRLGDVQAARARRVELAARVRDSWLRHSITANLWWAIADRGAQSEIVGAQQRFERGETDAAGGTRPFHVEGPHVDFADDGAMYDGLARVWARCSLQMHHLCEANGIRYCHFLQPNQYDEASKPLSEEELRVAYRADAKYRQPVIDGYPRLRAAGAELARQGVEFVDATMLFADVEESLYIDSCCHFNRRGNELLARAIAVAVTQGLGERTANDRGALLELRAEPVRLALDAPFATMQLRIIGRYAADHERHLTFAGAEFRAADPQIVRVDDHGVVTALRCGATFVHVAFGGRSIEVPVAVEYADVVSYGVGVVGRPKLAPRLSATIDSNRRVELTLHNAKAGALTTLLVGTRPERVPFGDLEMLVPVLESLHVPFATDPQSGRFTFDIPASVSPRTVYLQALVRDPRGQSGWLTSNGLALTPPR